MTTTVPIQGTCDSKFAPVREAFTRNFEKHGEVGAGVAITLNGQPVVDLWGGYADGGRSRPWQRDTLVNVYSTTKGLTAIAAHQLVEQGQMDIDKPVAHYWPEFAQAGKAEIPVRWLLSHRAGVVGLRHKVTPEQMFDWDYITSALAAEAPWWEPGTAHGYHAITYGWLVGEVMRRIDGRSPGTYFREEIARPLDADAHIGLAESEDGRVAEMLAAPPPPEGQPTLQDMIRANPDSAAAAAFGMPSGMEIVNARGWRGAEIPAANGHTTARALARIYGALASGGDVDGVHVLRPETMETAIVEQSAGDDLVIGLKTRFGLGFMLTSSFMPLGPNPRSFGHPGAGGSLGFADPDTGIGFGYVMNQMQMNLAGDPRVGGLIEAVYASL